MYTLRLAAGEDVPYIDENGEQQVCKEYRVFDAGTVSRDALGELGTETWYVVRNLENDVSGRFSAMGDVHLIICNGRDLTARQGIEVSENSSLTSTKASHLTGVLSPPMAERAAQASAAAHSKVISIKIPAQSLSPMAASRQTEALARRALEAAGTRMAVRS